MNIRLKRKLVLFSLTLICTVLYFSNSAFSQSNGFNVVAERLNNNEPIITIDNFKEAFNNDSSFESEYTEQGENINGASMFRIPDWIPNDQRADPSANYYLYFADHQGNYIRLAWASEITGPWTLHSIGLDEAGDRINTRDRGVFALPSADNARLVVNQNGRDLNMENHVASPDVHVDDENQQIIMYFHAPTNNPDGQNDLQKTFVATSDFGLDFNDGLFPVYIANSYARIFTYNNELYALAGDRFFRAPSLNNPFNNSQNIDFLERDLWDRGASQPFSDYFQVDPIPDDDAAETNVRHTDVYLDGDTLHVFFTQRRGLPERIMHTTVDLSQPFDEWTAVGSNADPTEVLRPEFPWEGSDVLIELSEGGGITGLVHQLRDPDVFRDEDGQLYLLYSGGGESAIGIARLSISNN